MSEQSHDATNPILALWSHKRIVKGKTPNIKIKKSIALRLRYYLPKQSIHLISHCIPNCAHVCQLNLCKIPVRTG